MSIQSVKIPFWKLRSAIVKLDYHSNEYRALPEAAQRDLYTIKRELQYELDEENKRLAEIAKRKIKWSRAKKKTK